MWGGERGGQRVNTLYELAAGVVCKRVVPVSDRWFFLQVIVVTAVGYEQKVRRHIPEKYLASSKVRLISSPRANKRQQMMVGVRAARTEFIAFIDDDVIFPQGLLRNLWIAFVAKQARDKTLYSFF